MNAKQKISKLTTAQVCELFEKTTTMRGDYVATTREWLMDELESRNPQAFEAWIDTTDPVLAETPSHFFN